jgi:virginiamycin B lyase
MLCVDVVLISFQHISSALNVTNWQKEFRMSRILSLLAIVTLFAAGMIDVQAQAGSTTEQRSIGHAVITEYLTASQASLPQGLDVDNKGNLWYAETNAGKIALLRRDKTATEYALPRGGQPFTLKAGPDGIWFTDSANNAIGYLTPGTGNIQEFAIPSGSKPMFLQIASDGSIWFTETAGIGRLAADGTTSEWSITLEHPDDNVEQLSIDPSGNIWFTERNFDGTGPAGTNKVRRFDPKKNVMSTYLVPTFGGNPTGVYANSDGTIWVSEYFANAFALLSPRTAPHKDEVAAPNSHAGVSISTAVPRTRLGHQKGAASPEIPVVNAAKPKFTPGWIEYFIPTAKTEAEDMRVDTYGRLWYEGDTGYLGVLNPLTAVFQQYSIPTQDSGYYNIALDHKTGTLWFTEAALSGTTPSKVGKLEAGGR